MLRLKDTTSDLCFIVEGTDVWADLDGDGRISSQDRARPERYSELVAAAASLIAAGHASMPGSPNQDGSILGGGQLNAVERQEFELPKGTAAARNLLEQHLSFFDPSRTGRIGIADNYRGWRALGFRPLKSVVQALGAALVFGWRQGGTIVINRIARSRPSGPTGIYDPHGNLDRERLDRLKAAFAAAAAGQALTVERAREVLTAQARLGRIPARQFESFFAVCTFMNGSPTVAVEQLEWLYDGSLLWRAGGSRGNGATV